MSDDRAATMADIKSLVQAVATLVPKTITEMVQPGFTDLATQLAALTKRVALLEPAPEPPPAGIDAMTADEGATDLEQAFERMTPEQRVEALLCFELGCKAAAHGFEHGDVTIEQVDFDVAEDSKTLCATAHLSDGNAVMAFYDPPDECAERGEGSRQAHSASTPAPYLPWFECPQKTDP